MDATERVRLLRAPAPARTLFANSTPIAALARRDCSVDRTPTELALGRRQSDDIRTRFTGVIAEQRERLRSHKCRAPSADSGRPLRICRQPLLDIRADAFNAYASSMVLVVLRSDARERTRLLYDSRPSASAAEIAGSARSAFAVRTLPRRDNDTPQLHTSHSRSSRSPLRQP